MQDLTPVGRRDALIQLGAAGAGVLLTGGVIRGRLTGILVAGQPAEIVVLQVSPVTTRLMVLPLEGTRTSTVPVDGALVDAASGRALARQRTAGAGNRVRSGNLAVRFSEGPPAIQIDSASGALVQRLTLDAAAPGMSFLLPRGPLLGLGQGGPQFDRKGTTDRMRSGQGGYQLSTHGGRVPIQWLVGTDGWAHVHPPAARHVRLHAARTAGSLHRVDGVAARRLRRRPRRSGRDHARVRAHHRIRRDAAALVARLHAVASDARRARRRCSASRARMREKKLPCDALIYLGTEFTPSGWNTRNGEFTWHSGNFPDPRG